MGLYSCGLIRNGLSVSEYCGLIHGGGLIFGSLRRYIKCIWLKCRFSIRLKLTRIFIHFFIAIRARVEASTLSKNGQPLHKVRVTKLYKRSRVTIGKKIDIEIIGREVTCKCESLQVRKTYLILGKERSRTNTFFLDDFSYAIEWPKGGKKMAKLHKKRKNCPKKFGMTWHPTEKS